jgi:hypothetical protein
MSASPVLTAIRTWRFWPSSATQSRIASAARTALGIVLVRHGSAEERHHGVADELLDGATEPLELGAQACMVGRQQRPDVLWI